MTDYISREAAIKTIEEKQRELCPLGMFSRHAVYGSDREKFDAWEEIIEQMEQIPAADVRKVKRGRWTYKEGGELCADGFYCTACGTGFHVHVPYFAEFNFCPNCGADMREES